MTPLTANIIVFMRQHLRRFFVLCPFIVMIFLSLNTGIKTLTSQTILSFSLGSIHAIYIAETLVRTFMFCVPGHRRPSRVILLGSGLALSMTLSILFWLFTLPTGQQTTFQLLLYFSLNMIFYLAGVLTIFLSIPAAITSLFLFSHATLLACKYCDLLKISTEHIPHIIVCGNIAFIFLAWHHLQENNILRTIRKWKNLLILKIVPAKQNYQATCTKPINDYDELGLIDNFFINQLMKYPANSTKQYIWGNVYLSIAQFNKYGLIMLFCMGIILVAWMKNTPHMPWYFFVIISTCAVNINFNQHSSRLTCGSRQVRFLSTIAVLLVWTILLSLILTVGIWFCAAIFPSKDLTLTGILANNIKTVLLIAALLPLNPLINISRRAYYIILFLLIISCLKDNVTAISKIPNFEIDYFKVILPLIVINWLIFIITMNIYYKKGQFGRPITKSFQKIWNGFSTSSKP